jgi:hypothetical protein
VGGEFGLANFVVREVEHGLIVIRLDGEDLFENTLKADDRAFGGRHLLLEELRIGVELDLDEIGGIDDFLEFSEVKTFRHDAELGGW